ncbi:MAG: tRNA-dihydrouridine synthase family protein [Candidatus Dojkabacteria bacterium]|nr:tRNA-dihydrouridine synthase family protein [Candidatus Dojkabacteria bacterium]
MNIEVDNNSNFKGRQNLIGKCIEIPVSVKTRIGYDEPVTESWIKNLEKESPEWISIHGRTLKQMYGGGADWDELKKAVEITDIPIMTNGDVKEFSDIKKMLDHTGSIGVLVGRASFGNPWVFQ